MIKNYKASLGALALFLMVGIATLTFAFKPAKTESKKTDTYWFLMNPDGTTVSNTIVTDPSTLCPNQDEPTCARQYDESQTQVVSGERKVKLAEVDSYIDFRSKD